jgi:NAD(P)H-hydrate epimerase
MKKVTYLEDTNFTMPAMPKRKQDSHKGDFGRLLCICGGVGMAGAAYLSAKAAYRCGAGLVEILTDEANRTILQTLIPEAIVTVYDSSEVDIDTVASSVRRADAIIAGCGLGKSEVAQKILECLLRKRNAPTLLDADALNIIAERNDLLPLIKGTIITPHLMEMSRLTKNPVSEISADVPTCAEDFAKVAATVCVLKCHNTAVADGSDRIYINRFGNSGMATGGSGDVLAGIIGGILAQNKRGELSNFEAAVLGVYLHSKAGDVAAESLGEYSLMASDIIDSLPKAITKL